MATPRVTDKVGELLTGDLGAYLKDQRETARLSLRQLATAAGVSNPYLSQIERGLRRPSAEVLQQIAKGLQLSAEALFLRAGLLEESEGLHVEVAIQSDFHLTARQKRVLLDIYTTFRAENARSDAADDADPATATAAEDAAETAEAAEMTAARKAAVKRTATKQATAEKVAARKAAKTTAAKKAAKQATAKRATRKVVVTAGEPARATGTAERKATPAEGTARKATPAQGTARKAAPAKGTARKAAADPTRNDATRSNLTRNDTD